MARRPPVRAATTTYDFRTLPETCLTIDNAGPAVTFALSEGSTRVPTNKQRREAARRHLERQLDGVEERARKQRNLIIRPSVRIVVVLAVVALMIALIANDDKKKKPSGRRSSARHRDPRSPCAIVAPPHHPRPPAPAATPSPGRRPRTSASRRTPTDAHHDRVLSTTTKGPMTLTLDGATAPCTVQSLTYLAKGLLRQHQCHRLVT